MARMSTATPIYLEVLWSVFPSTAFACLSVVEAVSGDMIQSIGFILIGAVFAWLAVWTERYPHA